ncbi:MAG: SMC-Scp complex subunit ScpB [Clostridiales bacterium]|nr:SMC-Scp complex subunit ScpB [Clostridiales bacterium]MDY2910003.1 SMC-Scp complex subunit ScpB [Oscillospiraceae bacterium]
MGDMNIKSALEAILFAAGEPVPAARISLILEQDEETVWDAARELSEQYEKEGRGIRILKLDKALQMCSAPEYAAVIGKTLEQRKPPMLSQPALETLAIVAYFQPVTRAYIDQVRGVDSSYTVGVLIDRGLIERCGKLDVPGRPSLLRTTDVFLRTMGISELSQLPTLPDIATGDAAKKLEDAIEKLSTVGDNQMSIEEI